VTFCIDSNNCLVACYHGKMDRLGAEKVLVQKGSYLMRISGNAKVCPLRHTCRIEAVSIPVCCWRIVQEKYVLSYAKGANADWRHILVHARYLFV